MGAGGREFHNFNVCFRNDKNCKVVAFTATQIPNIANRLYPPELSGTLYPKGIPIFPEDDLPRLIKKYKVNEVILAYSDISHEEVMHKASLALSFGCDFRLLGGNATMLKSRAPVISVCAVRTGCGKSKVTLEMAKILRELDKNVAIIRHPMPYGDLRKQICQRFEKIDDLKKQGCTIEEREEYEPLIQEGFVVFAGVDYKKILKAAEKEADVIVWDGGNNDLPFFKPALHIVLCDALRPGHELTYHPGETNLRMANLIAINKTNEKNKEDALKISRNAEVLNPRAQLLYLKSKITVDKPRLVKGKTVLVVEDGPSVTHGGLPFGAGYLAANKFGAKEIIDPKQWAGGEIRKAFDAYPHIKNVLPALGYGEKQIKELETLINAIPCQTVLAATPINLSSLIEINKPLARAGYEICNLKKPLTEALEGII
ncbi:MAG: GTPase [Candidatus Nealsonbacteria bacterium]|nr:GTPase [Candidatus Nealsonbacteria bacterium]